MLPTVSDIEATLQKMLAEHTQKQEKLKGFLQQHALERHHMQNYIEAAKANSMVQSIVTLRNYIKNQLNTGETGL